MSTTTTTTIERLDTAPFEGLLRAERDRITASLGELGGERAALLSSADAGREDDLDEGGGEGSTLSAELGRLDMLEEGLEERIAEVDAALGRIERGTYGVCRSCGGPIGAARLEALPEVTECVACKRAPLWARRSPR